MNKIITSIFLTSLCFFAFSSVFSQEKKFSEMEISALRDRAEEKLKTRSYRVKMISQSYRNVKDSAPYYFTNNITEYAPPDRWRSVNERKTVDGTTRTESIEIGSKRFVRANNEDWKEVTSEYGRDGGLGTIVENKKTLEYRYLGKKVINNQNSDVYEVVTTRKSKLEGKEDISINTRKFWLNEEGLFLKEETESKYNGKVFSNTVWIYEYDPNIKIEAPKMK